jgi:hypothetical protein
MTGDDQTLAGTLKNIDRVLHPEPHSAAEWRQMVENDAMRRLAAEISAAAAERAWSTVH